MSKKIPCVAAIDNQQVSRKSKTQFGARAIEFEHSITWIERPMPDLPTVINKSNVYRQRPSDHQVQQFISEKMGRISDKAAKFRDMMLTLPFDFSDIDDNIEDQFFVHEPFFNKQSTNPEHVKSVLDSLENHYLAKQPFVIVYCDEQLFQTIFNFVYKSQEMPKTNLIPGIDWFHWYWNIAKSIFRLYDFLQSFGQALEQKTVDAETDFERADWLITLTAAAAMKYFINKYGEAEMEKKFLNLNDVSSCEDQLLHFLYFADIPYVCSRSAIARRDWGNFWELFLFWYPHFKETNKSLYARLTIFAAYLHEWLDPAVSERWLQCSVLNWRLYEKHPIPIGLALEKVNLREKIFWGSRGTKETVARLSIHINQFLKCEEKLAEWLNELPRNKETSKRIDQTASDIQNKLESFLKTKLLKNIVVKFV